MSQVEQRRRKQKLIFKEKNWLLLRKMNIFVCLLFLLCITKISSQSLPIETIQNTTDEIVFTRKCYKGLGCFYTGPPYFELTRRPISLQPFSPKEMNTNFLLYTGNQKEEPYILEPTKHSISSSPFNKNIPTKIFIFGFLVIHGDIIDYSTRIKDALLEIGDYNVVIVDWSKANQIPYGQAVANARMLGAQIAQLIKRLNRTLGVSYESFHVIGHSLGAQAAGYVGKLIHIGRISGLDPAGPFFTGTPKEVHLQATDASFVDIIHTDMAPNALEGFGTTDVVGDIDFYPNGFSLQPGCEVIPSVDYTAAANHLCDHDIAQDYYIESIRNNNCTFIGTDCQSYGKYKEGLCKGNQTAPMGFPASKIPGLKPGHKFYLDTSSVPPYCIN